MTCDICEQPIVGQEYGPTAADHWCAACWYERGASVTLPPTLWQTLREIVGNPDLPDTYDRPGVTDLLERVERERMASASDEHDYEDLLSKAEARHQRICEAQNALEALLTNPAAPRPREPEPVGMEALPL